MKKKMNLATEIDLTQDSVVQLTCWCGQIALHELWRLGGKGQTGETLTGLCFNEGQRIRWTGKGPPYPLLFIN